MLTGLTLRNFKCFEAAEIPLGRITVLIGENGTGKSSVLHALALIRQSLGQGGLVYSGEFIDLSSYRDVSFKGLSRSDVQLVYASRRRVSGGSFSYSYGISSDEALLGLAFEFPLEFPMCEIEWRRDGPTQVHQNYHGARIDFSVHPHIGRHVVVNSASGKDSSNTLSEMSRILEVPFEDISSWRYTPVSRGFTRSSYDLSSDMTQELLGGHSRDAMDTALASAIVYDTDVGEQISEWLNVLTNVRISSGLVPGRRAQVRSVKNGLRVRSAIVNEGFGSNQLIAMLYQLAKTPPDGLDMIEEPELHLHPRAIARLADVLSSETLQPGGKQILLTTHSEHLLLGLLNNVAEGKLAASDLVVLYTSLTEGGAKVESVPVTDEGLVEGGLPGFFDATLEAQRRHLKALSHGA
jgi:predicted ATPase